MIKYLEKFIKYFTNILLILVIIAIFFALYSLIQLSVLDKDYANYFGYTVFEVESGSMEPYINVNDMILVKLTDDVKKGDVITYKQDDAFITHRVVEVGKNKIITKGDSNNSEDKIIEKEAVLGKIVKIFPRFGVWKEIILSPTVIIIIFLTLMMFSLGISYTGKTKDKKFEKVETKNFDEDVNGSVVKDEVKVIVEVPTAKKTKESKKGDRKKNEEFELITEEIDKSVTEKDEINVDERVEDKKLEKPNNESKMKEQKQSKLNEASKFNDDQQKNLTKDFKLKVKQQKKENEELKPKENTQEKLSNGFNLEKKKQEIATKDKFENIELLNLDNMKEILKKESKPVKKNEKSEEIELLETEEEVL